MKKGLIIFVLAVLFIVYEWCVLAAVIDPQLLAGGVLDLPKYLWHTCLRETELDGCHPGGCEA